jgi:hypothetical protein
MVQDWPVSDAALIWTADPKSDPKKNKRRHPGREACALDP